MTNNTDAKTAAQATGGEANKTTATGAEAGGANNQSNGQKEPSNALYNKDGSSAKPGEEPKPQSADEGGAKDAGSDKTTGEGTKPGEEPGTVPEKYADFKLPEGIEMNPAVMDEFTALAKEKNLSQEDAQRFVDMGTKIVSNLSVKQAEMLDAEKGKWESAARTDKEYGGDNFEANLAIAKKGFMEFMSPEGRKLLHETGLGSHPEIIRAFYRAGKAISEDDKHVPGGKQVESPKQPHEVLYPKHA